MRKHSFWKVPASLALILLSFETFGADQQTVGTLSEGSCWYDSKEAITVASFNDKTTFSATREEVESQLSELLGSTAQKIQDMDLVLHCGGYGASIVAKLTTEGPTLCVWAKFDNGKLGVRSIGVLEKNSHELCDGHKWGEFLVGIGSSDVARDLASAKWSSMIKEVVSVNAKLIKVVVTKEYQFKEQEIIDSIQESFTGKDLIRYIEYNDYRHPIGEFTHLK